MLSRRGTRRRLSGALVSAALMIGAATIGAPSTTAAPAEEQGTGSSDGPGMAEQTRPMPARPKISGVSEISDRRLRVYVDSPAMSRTVEVQVLLPRDRSAPRPTVYMLDGRSAVEDSNNWIERGGALQFYEDKNVNVVFTVGGPASYYTDWQRPDPVLGTNMWETFLTKELPPLIDARFNGNGRNALMGVSMGAEGAMMLAVREPQLYAAVAAHSGCYTSGSDLGQAQVRAVIATYKGDPDNMFGEPEDPAWLAHDVTRNAEALRGKAIYLSSGSGVPGKYEVPSNPDLLNAIGFGSPLEAGTNTCTRRLIDRLNTLGIAHTANLRPTGTHSWPYWADELVSSWPTIARGLGVE
ncbi:esterase family protein [Nocardia cyriacigeorgica]|uniref:alpha/beta hydrolase n=1 Tax=Nocardia cyriacigeorgica TaxID=135487 RepID=UPI001894E719|nr:alpha/beta hydrolase family protein [Nocardia cyriacigeorgica]MBF6087708.1 esterase family protein [Nocardia cyriacigeorgica]MBF6092345.1 esterase family protein [Nocardia cyriacigeorgica]MBF6396938.1 esterase family protein [Nocardia cyriacigeorgica]MBF6403404.1 esterase family protein [Nocardia cyriacigeorgica]